jgi:hypothetical protein
MRKCAACCQAADIRRLDVPVDLFGGCALPPIAMEAYPITITGHGFYWLRLPSGREARAGTTWRCGSVPTWLERVRYEAQRAERQHDAIEPENRPVARELETRWNAALQVLKQLEHDYAVVRRTELLTLDEAWQQTVRQLAADLPGLWHAATTADLDRKRMLRLAVTEIVLTVDARQRCTETAVVWTDGMKKELASLPTIREPPSDPWESVTCPAATWPRQAVPLAQRS